jgi:hypothetical protein
LLLRIRSHHLLDALHRQIREASSRLLITERRQIAARGRRSGLAFPLAGIAYRVELRLCSSLSLTVADMKEYAERIYHASRTADLMTIASD